jgi:nucleoid DNA-binding protein/cell division septation protein DedD
MNKTEIIRKISKKAGVPDTEAKRFFEIFLKRASDELNPGEALKLPGVGLFQLRVGQIENSINKQSGKNYIYSDLIVFDEEGSQVSGENEEIIFNVPSGIEEEYQPIDSHFSLSLGKPIIPLRGVRASEFFIPPSGTELRGLIESKVDRLFEESERIIGGKETQSINLKSSGEQPNEKVEPHKSETDSNEKVKTKIPSRSDFLKTREFENLSWDFGENLSHEIEDVEESDYDLEKTFDTAGSNEVEQQWTDAEENFEPGDLDEEPGFEEEKIESDVADEEIFEEAFDDEPEETFEKTDAAISELSEDENIENRVEEAGTVSDEKQNDQFGENIDSEKNNSVETESGELTTEEPFLKNFQRVTSFTKEFSTNAFDDVQEEETEQKPKKVTEVRAGFQKVRRTTAEFDFDLSGIKDLDEEEDSSQSLAPEKKEKIKSHRPSIDDKGKYRGYNRKSSLPSFIIAFVVVLAMAGVIFLYLKLKSANHENNTFNSAGNSKQSTKVIDRNYDVPVTYPYKPGDEKNSETSKTGTDNSSKNEKNKVEQKSQKPVSENINTTDDLIREPVNAKNLATFIYQYPEGVMVQVSSWKSKSIAITEVEKYRKAGYTAFAEPAIIPGKGNYYRVRVGYFKSLDEAKKFVTRNY